MTRWILSFLLLVPLPLAASEPCAQWVGGVMTAADYTAAVLRVGARSGSAAFPNQRRAVRFTSIVRDGNELRLEALPDERWSGRIEGDTFRGAWSGGAESGKFELVCAPDVPVERLRSYDGTYRFDDGRAVRIAFLSRITDDILVYFDPSARDERWLFPTSPTTFVAGPTFEKPRPIERRFELTGDGLRVTSDRGSQVARRETFAADVAAIEHVVPEFLRAHDVPGVSVAIGNRDGLQWSRGFGYADRARQVEATSATPYQIGSVTKLFTATLLVRLADRGLLRLDDPIARWLPPDVTLEKTITFRDLVTHVSGLPGNPINRVDVDGVMQPYEVPDLLAGLSGTVLQSPPGTRWSYSNLGFALLGYLMERVAGRSYAALLSEGITAPLGLTHTAIALTPETEAHLAAHYWPEDAPRKPRPRWRFGAVAAFGGIASTVDDLARFVAMHLRATESDPLAQMQRPQITMGGGQRAMAIGWMVRRDNDGTTTLFHGGEVDGNSSFVVMSPQNNIAVIVLANLGGTTAEDLAWSLFTITLTKARHDAIATRAEAFDTFFRGAWADAAAMLEKLAAPTPDDGVLWSRLGIALARAGRPEAACPALTRAAALDYRPEEAMYELSALAATRADIATAAEWATKAIASGVHNIDRFTTAPEFANVRCNPQWLAITKGRPCS